MWKQDSEVPAEEDGHIQRTVMPTFDHRPKNSRKPWQARVRMYGYSVWLGYYETYMEALKVENKERDLYRREVEHGEP